MILTQPIYLGIHEVTQAEYQSVMGMGRNPSYFAARGEGNAEVAGMDADRHPVDSAKWTDAAEFCTKLSQREQLKPIYFRSGETVTLLDGTGYRLPTEAEWEFSCLAGAATKFWFGDTSEDLVGIGWFAASSGHRTHAVGELRANPFGLFDIQGNVWEWMQDGWDATYYSRFQDKPATNPSGPSSAGPQRMIRGGSWGDDASLCRASTRYASFQTTCINYIGFRVSLPVDDVKR